MLNVRGVKLDGLAMKRGAIAVFATGLATGAARLGATRTEPVCTVGLIPCPAAVRMLAAMPAMKQSAKNLKCFIKCSAN